MVYKRYITRKGKKFGPYYYESYRDENGISRTRKVDSPKKAFKLFYFFMICSLFLMIAFVTLNINLEKSPNGQTFEGVSSNGGKEIIGKVIQSFFVGFNVLEEEIVNVEDNIIEEIISEITQSSEEEISLSEDLPEEEVDEPLIIEETTPEIIDEEQITQEINQTQEEIIPIVDEPTQNVTIKEENITEINQTPENINLITNETIQNITIENKTVQGINFTTEISTLHYEAVLGKPVKWKKIVKLEVNENETINNLTITLPKLAGNISIKKISANKSVEELKVNVKNEKIVKEREPMISITGKVVKSKGEINIFKKIFRFFRNFISIVGRVIDMEETQEEVLINIQEELKDQEEVEIEYYTDAPYAEEIVYDGYKEITIVGPEEVHYENVLAFSELLREIDSLNKINLYWIVNNSKVLTEFNAYDSDENGLYDYIEWVVPSLSNQTYEIILITKAEHLDSNRSFIEDVYEEVKERDQNYTEIPVNNYIRVTFEKDLTSENDITIYAKSNSTASIEVYEENSFDIIARFELISKDKKYKIYLTNLSGTQDTFDLKVIENSIWFDYIVDPSCPDSMSGSATLTDPCLITNWTQLQAMNQSLSYNYSLANNLDSTTDGFSLYQSDPGFNPIGNSTNRFTGRFFGNKNSITNLFINRSGEDYVGLFGFISGGNITSVKLIDVNISGKDIIGGLVGESANTRIEESSVSGNVNGIRVVGGLVGICWETNIFNSNSSVVVVGVQDYIGGLVGTGYDVCEIRNSSSFGSVSGRNYVGGLVGSMQANDALVNNSFSLASVSGSDKIGGLVGGAVNVFYSYATGSVSGDDHVGGLVGYTQCAPFINSSYATGSVSASGDKIGGLIGWNQGNITESYANGSVSGRNYVGGLVGDSPQGISLEAYCIGYGEINCNDVGGNSFNIDCNGADSTAIMSGPQTSDEIINNSYSTGNVTGNDSVGGFVGKNAINISNSYSTGNVTGNDSVGGFVGQDNVGIYVTNFWNLETDGGSYDGSGNSGNLIGIIGKNTASLKDITIFNSSWDFCNDGGNIWAINDSVGYYSYPCLNWEYSYCGCPGTAAVEICDGLDNDNDGQTDEGGVCPTSGSGGLSPTVAQLKTGFEVNPEKMIIVLEQGETKSECFKIKNIGWVSLSLSLSVLPDIVDFTSLSDYSLNLPIQNSKTVCTVFSTSQFDLPENYTGQIKISGKQKKFINVSLEIIEGVFIPLNLTNITELEELIGGRERDGGKRALNVSDQVEDFIKDKWKKIPLLIKGVVILVLWFLLLLLLLAYFIIRKYVQIKDHLGGYSTREEKIAALNRLKRASLRKNKNFFEGIVDKGALYLVGKMEVKGIEGEKALRLAVIIKSKEAYNLGMSLYQKKDYDNALKEFQKSVEINNKFWQGYQGVGNCYATKGMLKETISAYEKSLSINPNNAGLIQWLKKYKR